MGDLGAPILYLSLGCLGAYPGFPRWPGGFSGPILYLSWGVCWRSFSYLCEIKGPSMFCLLEIMADLVPYWSSGDHGLNYFLSMEEIVQRIYISKRMDSTPPAG